LHAALPPGERARRLYGLVKPSKPANDDTKVVDLMAALKKGVEGGGGAT
jgi:hypothetical protein